MTWRGSPADRVVQLSVGFSLQQRRVFSAADGLQTLFRRFLSEDFCKMIFYFIPLPLLNPVYHVIMEQAVEYFFVFLVVVALLQDKGATAPSRSV